MKTPGSGRRSGHTRQILREKAARYGLEVGHGGGNFRGVEYSFEDASGKIYGLVLGMMQAEIFLEGVAVGWKLTQKEVRL